MTGNTIITLVKKEVNDAFRNIWLLIFTAAYFLLVLGIPFILLLSLHLFGTEDVPGQIVVTALDVIPIVPLLPLLLGGIGIVGEREKGTMDHLLSQPVSRSEVFLGKYIGLLIASSFVILAGVGGASLLAFLFAPEGYPGSKIGTMLLLMLSLSTISLGVATLISSLTRSRAIAIGLSLFAWIFLTIIFELGLLDFIILAINGSPPALLTLSFINPIDITRIMAVIDTSPNINTLGPSGAEMVLIYGLNGAFYVLGIASIIWMVVPFFASWLIFARQDG